MLSTLAVSSLIACGGQERREAAAPSLTPFPSIDMADLAGGTTYTTKQFRPNITLTLPAGEWKAVGGDSPDHVEIEPTPRDPVDSSAIGFHHMRRVFDPATGGETPGDAVAAPADFAAWLTGHPHLKTTTPKPVEALGLKGVSIDVRVRSSQPRKYRDCGKLAGDCVVMFIGKIEPLVYGSASFARFYVLEQPDGKQLVVEQYIEPASAFRAQRAAFQAVLESAKVDGG